MVILIKTRALNLNDLIENIVCKEKDKVSVMINNCITITIIMIRFVCMHLYVQVTTSFDCKTGL